MKELIYFMLLSSLVVANFGSILVRRKIKKTNYTDKKKKNLWVISIMLQILYSVGCISILLILSSIPKP